MDNGHIRKSSKVLLVLAFISSVICGLCFRNANVSASTMVIRNNFSHFEYNKGKPNFSLYEINPSTGDMKFVRQYNTNGAFVENIKYSNSRILVRTQEGDICFLETRINFEPRNSKLCDGMSFESDNKNSAGSSNSSSTNTNAGTSTMVIKNNFSHFEYNKGEPNFSLYEINQSTGDMKRIQQYDTNGAFVENIKYNNGRILVRTQEGDICFLEANTTFESISSKACDGMSFESDNKNSVGSSNSSSTNTNAGTTTATTNNATNTNKGSSTTTSTTTTTSKKTNTNNNSSSKSSGSSDNSSNNQSSVDTGASGPSGAVESDVCKQANIPEAVKLAAGCAVTVNGEQKTAPNIQNVIMGIINGVIAVLGVICVAVIIYGGIRYMTSVGEQEKVKKAKNTILYAVIGLIICALSFAITNFVVGVLNNETSTSTSQSNSSSNKDAGNSNSDSKNEKKK